MVNRAATGAPVLRLWVCVRYRLVLMPLTGVAVADWEISSRWVTAPAGRSTARPARLLWSWSRVRGPAGQHPAAERRPDQRAQTVPLARRQDLRFDTACEQRVLRLEADYVALMRCAAHWDSTIWLAVKFEQPR